MKTKEQLIKEAYKDNYDLVKEFIDKDGWCTRIDYSSGEEKINHKTLNELGFYKDDGKLETYMSDKGHFWRPIELKEFQHNNGWINIYSLEDLPDNEYFQRTDIELDHVWCRRIDGLEYVIPVQNLTYTNHTHWQPILKYNSPVY